MPAVTERAPITTEKQQFLNAMRRIANLCIGTLGDVVKPDLAVLATGGPMTLPEVIQLIPDIAPPFPEVPGKLGVGDVPSDSETYYKITGGVPVEPEKASTPREGVPETPEEKQARKERYERRIRGQQTEEDKQYAEKDAERERQEQNK